MWFKLIAMVISAFAISVCSTVTGQCVAGGIAIRPPGSVGIPVRTVVASTVTRVTSTTGSLAVAAEPDADLLVEPIRIQNAVGQRGIVPANERIFIFNDLKPGRYRVAGTLAGHYPAEREVTIQPNTSRAVALDLRPILYSVTINTNITTGELKYAREGQPLSTVVPIQNKNVQLNLPAGVYVVEIRAAEFGYESLRTTFSLTTDQTALDMRVRRIAMTTETLSPVWTNAELQGWDMPAAWRPDSKKNLVVKGSGVAFPREEGYSYYKDFRLFSTARMINGVGLSFALRGRDSQNYYLLQLTGPKSDEPNTARLFVVKNGVEQRISSVLIPKAGIQAMGSGQFFTVSIRMIDFTITVEIEDSDTGASFPMGGLTDPVRNFGFGAVGIAGHGNEENVIGRFVVCGSEKCLKN